MARGNRTHKRGHRKCLYRKTMVFEGYKLGALGLTLREIADFWNIGWTSLQRYGKQHPELEISIAKGKAEADLTVIQALLEQCRNGNVVAAIFWLKNRQPEKWRDVHHEFKNEIQIHNTNFQKMSDEQIYKEAIKRGYFVPDELRRRFENISGK